MGLVASEIQTVQIPKDKWEALIDDQPWYYKGLAQSLVTGEGTVTQLAWWVKAGVGIAVVYLAIKYGSKLLKV